MKILPGQVFTLHDKPFSGVSRTFQAKEQFDLSEILMNGTYQYDFAHKYYGEEESRIMIEERVLLDWFTETYKDLVNETIAGSKTTDIRFIIARDIQIGNNTDAFDYVAIEEDNRYVITFPDNMSFFKVIPTQSLSNPEAELESLSANSLIYDDKASALKAWKQANDNDDKTTLSIVEIKLPKVVLNFDDEHKKADTYFRTLEDVKKEDFQIHSISNTKKNERSPKI